MLGIGFDFDLPITRYSSSTGLKTDEYSEWYGYLTCKGVIVDSAIDSFYNSGTYLHQFSAITINPTFHVVGSTQKPHLSAYIDVSASIVNKYARLTVPVQQLT